MRPEDTAYAGDDGALETKDETIARLESALAIEQERSERRYEWILHAPHSTGCRALWALTKTCTCGRDDALKEEV